MLKTKAMKKLKKYNENPDNQATINTAILKKYNELILAGASRKYFLHDGTYVAKVENDLGVITKNVNYDVTLNPI